MNTIPNQSKPTKQNISENAKWPNDRSKLASNRNYYWSWQRWSSDKTDLQLNINFILRQIEKYHCGRLVGLAHVVEYEIDMHSSLRSVTAFYIYVIDSSIAKSTHSTFYVLRRKLGHHVKCPCGHAQCIIYYLNGIDCFKFRSNRKKIIYDVCSVSVCVRALCSLYGMAA